MSKFLRVLTRVLLIILVAAGAALLVPPLFGIDTVVVENEASSNMQRGDVAYVQTIDASQLKEGDKIIRVTDDGAVNTYTVESYDDSSRNITATKSSGAAEEELHAANTIRKILLTVPYLGYLSIATESFTGLLILGGVILVIIILIIIGEVTRKDDEEEEEERSGGKQGDDEYFSSLGEKKTEPFEAEQKASEKEKDFPVEGEGETFIRNLKSTVSGRGSDIEGDGVVNTGSLHDTRPVAKAAPDEEEKVQTDGLPDVQAALEAALDGRQISYNNQTERQPVQIEPEIRTGEIELAIPVHTAEEFLDKAHKDGDDPELREDEVTGIKFIDYSDCL